MSDKSPAELQPEEFWSKIKLTVFPSLHANEAGQLVYDREAAKKIAIRPFDLTGWHDLGVPVKNKDGQTLQETNGRDKTAPSKGWLRLSFRNGSPTAQRSGLTDCFVKVGVNAKGSTDVAKFTDAISSGTTSYKKLGMS